MPIYEYKCANCGKINEFLEGVGQGEEEKICKFCGSKQLVKIFSVINVLSEEDGINFQDKTCCGKDEPCEKPPCSKEGRCVKDD